MLQCVFTSFLLLSETLIVEKLPGVCGLAQVTYDFFLFLICKMTAALKFLML